MALTLEQGAFQNLVFHVCELPRLIPHPAAGDIAPVLQFPDDTGNSVRTFLVLMRQIMMSARARPKA